jgi:hypothetical protein
MTSHATLSWLHSLVSNVLGLRGSCARAGSWLYPPGPRMRPATGAMSRIKSKLSRSYSRDLRRETIEDRKAELVRLLRSAKTGLQVNEHLSEPGGYRVPARLQARVGRHRVQARRLALQICASPRRRDDLAHPRRHAFGRLENFLLATLLER